MGGGRKSFDGDSFTGMKDVTDKHMCVRTDGRNLINEWTYDKASKRLSYEFLDDLNSIYKLDTENTDYILGKYNSESVLYTSYKIILNQRCKKKKTM